MSKQFPRRAATFVSRCGSAVRVPALALALLGPGVVEAAVTGVGDITPTKTIMDEEGNEFIVPDLPQFGNTRDDAIELLVIGGTGQRIGGTASGAMTIGVPADTDPLWTDRSIIGGNIFGLGNVQIAGLNSEWIMQETLTVGHGGQGFLTVQAGAIVTTDELGMGTENPGDDDYDLMVGRRQGSQGFITVDGTSNSSLLLTTNASVGHGGRGRIDVTNRARFVTISEAAIGTLLDLPENVVGQGHVRIDGAGTRWTVGVTGSDDDPEFPTPDDDLDGLLIVGLEGRGVLEVLNQGVVQVETDTIVGQEADSFGKILVSGDDSQLWTLEDLVVGNDTGSATGELHLAALGEARADGETLVGPRGLINMAGGTLLTPSIVNEGVIRGDGRIDSDLITNTGDIRNAAGLANVRERLLFTGDIDNTSNIESFGGEMEFQGVVINTTTGADLVGIDAIFRFQGGLQNDAGANLFLENTLVYVPQSQSLASAGSFSLLAGESTLVGDLELEGSNELNVELGSNKYGRLQVTGDASIGGGVNVFLTDDYLPSIGDAFEIIDAGALTGTFATISGGGSGPGFWQATYTTGSAILNYVADIVSTIASDFDGNGVVDAGDLAVWQMNFGLEPATRTEGDANGDGKVDGADFFIWQTQLGQMAPAVPAGVPAAGTVPEPSGLALAAVGMLALVRRRVRS